MPARSERPPAGSVEAAQTAVRAALAGTRFSDVTWVAETGSTNDDLAAAALAGAGERVLVTDLQTAGRGRRGRVWDAPSRSSVLMSILVRGVDPRDGFWVVGAVALAAVETIRHLVTGVECSLKWPNDIMLGDRKVAGVLAHIVDDATIVGIGINVDWPAELPTDLRSRATAVNHHLAEGATVDRTAFVIDMLRCCTANLELDRAALRAAWTTRCSTLGSAVRLELDAGRAPVEGRAVDVDPHGALVIDHRGTRTVHHVGEVVHLRPAP